MTKNTKPNNERVILIYIQHSWGELHWILPVCRHIKRKDEQVKIVVFFNAYSVSGILKDNQFLNDLLHDTVDQIVDIQSLTKSKSLLGRIFGRKREGNSVVSKVFNRIHHQWFQSYIENNSKTIAQSLMTSFEPDMLIRDTGNDRNIRKETVRLAREKGIPIYMMPHGCSIHMEIKEDRDPVDGDADVLLCPSEGIIPFYCVIRDEIERKVVGNPRYDQEWIDYVRTFASDKTQSTNLSNNGKRNILFITRYPHIRHLSPQTYKSLIYDTAKTVLANDDTFLIIRPHPRETIGRLKEIMKPFDQNRWTIDYTEIFSISDHIYCAVSMWSSAILDAVAAGIPVIEFYKFEGSNFPWLKDEKGDYTTVHRKAGLALGANSLEQFEEAYTLLQKDYEIIKKEQYQNLQRHSSYLNDSCRVVSDLLLENIKKNDLHLNNL